ncbi:SDR family oxidoreductase [Membranihabitans marinus]|uniref:SDR family oxidoreductase n=1 Tax=Membranihabitans marinus TaxID=1227546 RepID=UPI001F28ED85|nr:SDR family oxidoreductase [Membranihabitans marinus]
MNIVITGATEGIGKAIAYAFASKDNALALCARTFSKLEVLKADILTSTNCTDVFIQSVDVTNHVEINKFAKNCLEHWTSIDVLINNAGVFIPGKIHEEDDGVLEMTMNTNVYSAYRMSRSFIPQMISQGSGHIINISSVAGLKAYPNGGSYSISKFAMLGLGKGLREELKEYGIRVTNIMPGATWSNSWAGVDLPKDRLMEASDIAKIVLLATELENKSVLEDVVVRPLLGDL